MTWSITNHVLLNTFLAMYEPECLSLNYEIIASGLVAYIPALGPVLRVLTYHFFEMNTYITICRFLFRYAQTTERQRLMGFLSHKRFFRFLYLLFVLLLLKSVWYSRFMWVDGDEFKRNFPSSNATVKKYILDRAVLIARDSLFLSVSPGATGFSDNKPRLDYSSTNRRVYIYSARPLGESRP
ncbi:unnamed protein product [Bursaphelenchus xylophilus]|uniref:(pine wood nematode) hypothetical protein n=1 Tax=Bursaphelenchus xylophilus TaxID=6326 RepID=A0A1I7SMW8_BURXY|nr:unnamed protein product [Bursaphelenchus xylophilus]CAG9100393.1 unnamed protein product [Bursaphelenchus xylophilus]